MEPLIEMMQIKGNSEVTRQFWPTDEFANFENGDSMAELQRPRLEGQGQLRPLGRRAGHRVPARPRRQPVQVRLCRRHRQPRRRDRAIPRSRAISAATAPPTARVEARRTGNIDGWIDRQGFEPRRADRRLGDEEHPRRDLGRPAIARDLRDIGHADEDPHVRRREPRRADRPERTGQGTATPTACRWAAI